MTGTRRTLGLSEFLFHQQMGNDSWLIIIAMFGIPAVIGMAAQKVSVNRGVGQADNEESND
jgi:hypothetical protein